VPRSAFLEGAREAGGTKTYSGAIVKQKTAVVGGGSSVWDCMLIRRSAKMLAENVDGALSGFKKRIRLPEKQLLNLRCHRITMVQATESRKGLNLPFTRRANFCRPSCWRVLRESEVRPVLVIIEQVGRHQPL
jgi:hypothetical protein